MLSALLLDCRIPERTFECPLLMELLRSAEPVLRKRPASVPCWPASPSAASRRCLLELALTRLFSVVLFYHFAFLAISIALLGLGSGGVFAYLGKDLAGPLPDPQSAFVALRQQCFGRSGRFGNRAARPGFTEFVASQFSPAYRDLSGFRGALLSSQVSNSRSSLLANRATFRGSTERTFLAARWLVWELSLCSTG